jgi:hypothetical protein
MNNTKRTYRFTVIGLIMAALFLGAANRVASAASILGDTVTVEYLYPNSSTEYGLSASGTVTVSGVTLNLFGNQTVTVFGTDVQMVGLGSYFQTATFNGVSIQDMTNPSAFTSFSVDADTTVSGFTSSDVSISGGLLYINYEGLTTPSQSLAQVDFTSATSVPEPGSLALITTGLLGVVTALRLKKKMRH